MSSEESCDEYVEEVSPAGAFARVQVFRTRGLPWRSSRLLRMYAMLDAEEEAEQMVAGNTKPRRSQGRKERCVGPPKDGFILPPNGVSSWMVSRRWIRENRETHPGLEDQLSSLTRDQPGFDWRNFDVLGEESEDDGQEEAEEPFIPRSDTSYSLAHALASP